MPGNVNSGPIPGAAMTSDTKSQPWRQPPTYTDMDKALDYLTKKITKFKAANEIMNMIEMGIPVVQASQVILMQGVSQGFWSIDLALMMSGPLTRMIEILAISYDVQYELGLNDEPDFHTGVFLKGDIALKAPHGFQMVKDQIEQVAKTASSTPQDGTGAGSAQGGEVDPNAGAAGQNEQPLQQGGFMAMTAGPTAGADKGAPKQ
jgi:hypothetical protein